MLVAYAINHSLGEHSGTYMCNMTQYALYVRSTFLEYLIGCASLPMGFHHEAYPLEPSSRPTYRVYFANHNRSL